MGIDSTLVPVYVHVQVNIFIFMKITAVLTLFTSSNIWPIVRVGPVFSGIHQMVFSSPVFWLGLILIPITSLLLDVIVKV
jgi:hypothetical protein